MAIYLDSMGHLFSDKSLKELYDFAVGELKLKPEWNHYSRHFPHFDLITKNKINQAIKKGAIYLEIREALPIIRSTKKVYKKEYPLPHYKSKGLRGQDILRVDFKAYFSPSEPA